MKQTFLTLFLILSVLSGGCTTAAPAQTVVPYPAAVENEQPAAAAPTQLAQPTSAPPTSTAAPTDTPEPPTATPAPTETTLPSPTATEQAMAEFRFTGSVRQMPDAGAAVVASFGQGIRLRALYQDPSGQWYYVQIAPFSYGWVFQSDVTGSGLAELAQATPDITPTPKIDPSAGLKCRITVDYSNTGKSKSFQLYVQGLTAANTYLVKLFHPDGGLLLATKQMPSADGILSLFHNYRTGSTGIYTMYVFFEDTRVATCSAEVVQK